MFKSVVFFFGLLLSLQGVHAQSVGIGTNNPHNSAALDITSTNKGFLPPLVSQSARLAISNPAEGLMVYDTTFQRFYQYQLGIWRYIINSDIWVQSSTANNLYNLTDSIGIGTSVPQHRLDVNGNIHATQSINVASSITATGNAEAGTLLATNNLSADGLINVSGNINGGSNAIIDNTTATLQLRNNGVNKAFFQRNGNDLRLGTNTSNVGKTVIRMNGDDVVTIDKVSNLTLKKGLFANRETGKMVIGNRVIRSYSVTANTNSLPILYGRIFSDGFGAAMWPQSGSSSRISTGVYEIDTNRADMSDFGVIIVTSTGIVPRICIGRYIGNAKFRIEIFSLSGNPVNNDFYFMINDPLN